MHNMHSPDLDLDLNLLRVFYAVFEAKNVSLAADRLQLSQSAASHAIGRLRKQLGDPLFVRTAAGMQATPLAEQLAKPVGEALEQLSQGVRSARGFDPARTDRCFKIFLSDIGQVLFLPKILSYFKEHAPGAAVQVPPIPLRGAHLLLESGEVDLAIGHFDRLVAGFHQKHLFRERYVCVMRRGHPNFRRGMSVEAFIASDHAMADSSGMAHHLLEQSLLRAGIRRPSRLIVPEFMVLPLITQSSDLVVVMPSRLADQFSRLLSLQVLPLPVEVSSYDVQIYWHDRYHRDPANKWLRGIMSELLSGWPVPPIAQPG